MISPSFSHAAGHTPISVESPCRKDHKTFIPAESLTPKETMKTWVYSEELEQIGPTRLGCPPFIVIRPHPLLDNHISKSLSTLGLYLVMCVAGDRNVGMFMGARRDQKGGQIAQSWSYGQCVRYLM